MTLINEKIVTWLFETTAVRVSPEDKPFWYTSGTVGPFYINTHFLYGSEEKANNLLKVIDGVKNSKLECPGEILKLTLVNYSKDLIYKGLIDEMLDYINKNLDIEQIDYISGGERRDWFFSLILAEKLNKPHITIYKDQSTVLSSGGVTKEIESLNSAKVLHIADLITEASSYERAWIPAIKEINGEILWSLVVIDRKQGGGELLKQHDVQSNSLVNIDIRFFDTALSLGLIDNGQYNMIEAYMQNPKEAMREFLKKRPEFLKEALKADDKTRERARLCIEKDFYGLARL